MSHFHEEQRAEHGGDNKAKVFHAAEIQRFAARRLIVPAKYLIGGALQLSCTHRSVLKSLVAVARRIVPARWQFRQLGRSDQFFGRNYQAPVRKAGQPYRHEKQNQKARASR